MYMYMLGVTVKSFQTGLEGIKAVKRMIDTKILNFQNAPCRLNVATRG